MISCLRTRVRVVTLYFEFETVLKFYNLDQDCDQMGH